MQSSASESSATLASAVSAATANEQPGLSEKAKTTNKQLRAISRAVAKMLAEEELRQYVYHRAMEKFDGETNVLWMQLNDRNGHDLPQAMQQSSGKPWASLVKSNLAPGKAQSLAPKLGDVIDRAGQLMGGPVHLYWAFAENFKSDRRAPLITFTPLGVDADEITDLIAYDASGDSHVVNGEIAKKRPLIVLTANERTDAQGNPLGGLATPNALPAPCETDCGGGGGGGDATLEPRESGDTEYFDRFNVRNDHERFEWLRGSEEIKYRILSADAGQIAHEYLGSNGDVDDNGDWHTIDEELFPWYHDSYGDFLVVVWYEHDSGDTVTQNIPINDPVSGETITTISVSATDDDDPMGRLPVHINDPASMVYDTDDIAWTHRWE